MSAVTSSIEPGKHTNAQPQLVLVAVVHMSRGTKGLLSSVSNLFFIGVYIKGQPKQTEPPGRGILWYDPSVTLRVPQTGRRPRCYVMSSSSEQ